MKKKLAFLTAFLITLSSIYSCSDSSDNQSATLDSIDDITSNAVESVATTFNEVPTIATTVGTFANETVTTTSIETTPSVQDTTTTIDVETNDLNSVQENSIAWLNYLAMLSQEINSSKNSKLYLEEAYAALINNTNPANVNELTESHLVSLLDIIEKYRMIAVKRDRLQYIYEQNQAKALKAAVPDPVGLLSATVALDVKGIISSLIYMGIDSYSSYSAYSNEINQEYLKDGWELDDEAAANLHDSRKRAFTYMIDIVREYDLPGDLALNESSIEKFVECKNNPNVHQQIQYLEANKSTYHAFGNYWLLLAECYYNNGDYQKCLDSVKEYRNLHSDIFRKDYNLARTLPLAIASAKEVQSTSEYVKTSDEYLDLIIKNTESDEWALRYFAAEVYSELYAKSNNTKYLRSAYDLALNNVNNLSVKQNEINETYIADVKEIAMPEDATKKEKKQIKAYNKAMKEKRETELPEIYEPLALNCELLFSLSNKLNISQTNKNRIDGILAGHNYPVFLTDPVKNLFTFSPSAAKVNAKYDKDELVLPVSCVSEGAKIKVTVTSGDKCIVYEDWKIDEVERPKKDFSSYKVTYKSKKADGCTWHEDSLVKVEIVNGEYTTDTPYVINFKVSKFKDHKIGWDTVEFEQVD